MTKFFKWVVGLFKSNGKVPKPNNVQEDWIAEYHKIKDTLMMKDISVCLMQDGGYKIVNKGIPVPSLMNIQTLTIEDSLGHWHTKFVKITKQTACRKCVEYYRGRVKHKRSHTVVEKI